jgi:hypothetical protein
VFGSTMLLTVGHALDRAKDEGLVVRLHIGGDWVTGRVLNSDGHGVAIMEPNGDLCVVRQDVVTCVRLPGSGPPPPTNGGGPHVPAQASTAIESAY